MKRFNCVPGFLLTIVLFVTACAQLPAPTMTPVVTRITITPEPPTPVYGVPSLFPEGTSLPLSTVPPPLTGSYVHPFWQQFKGPGFEIWLPRSYKGGAGLELLLEAADTLREAGFAERADSLEASATYILFYAQDSISLSGNGLTNLSVMQDTQTSPGDWNIEQYAELSRSQSEVEHLRLLSSESFAHPVFEGHKLVLKYDLSGDMGTPTVLRVVQYFLKGEDCVWILTFGTPSAEFDERRDEFDDSAVTFHDLPAQ